MRIEANLRGNTGYDKKRELTLELSSGKDVADSQMNKPEI